jgi:murein L,D-transpeptidase YafK
MINLSNAMHSNVVRASARLGIMCALSFLVFTVACATTHRADLVRVTKAEAKLELISHGQAFASFHVAFGGNPVGHKQRQGDGRTPEGRYTLDARNEHSSYYKSLHVSYPNTQDRERAKRLGVSAGGDIMIHGQPNGWGAYAAITQARNWTLGCIALTNEDMDVVWSSVSLGTPIEIQP